MSRQYCNGCGFYYYLITQDAHSSYDSNYKTLNTKRKVLNSNHILVPVLKISTAHRSVYNTQGHPYE